MSLRVDVVSVEDTKELITRYHYSKIMPRHTRHRLGLFRDDLLVGVVTFGWGVRPLHTIRKLFPSLTTVDYYEIGKLCVADEEPRNTESQFLSLAIKWLRGREPRLRVLYTWADGFWGKPGYVYQAANFLYGGFIWTDRYIDADGRLVHPLGSKTRGRNMCVARERRTRPSIVEQAQMGWHHYWGKQFRYVYFLCPRHERRGLLAESTVSWTRQYPKTTDLEWKLAAQGSKVSCEAPSFTGGVRFPRAAPRLSN